jgi:hypothetical protein
MEALKRLPSPRLDKQSTFYLLSGSFKCDESFLNLGLYSTLDEAIFHYLMYYGTNGVKLNRYSSLLSGKQEQGKWEYERSAEALHCLLIQPIRLGGINKYLPYTIYTIIENQKAVVKFNIKSRELPCLQEVKNLDWTEDAELDFDFVYPEMPALTCFKFY